jgi:hypothetical protein
MRHISFVLLTLLGCGPGVSQNTGGADAHVGPDGRHDTEFADAGTPGVCGELNFEIEFVPPYLMILLDRSSSMGDDLESGGTKWGQAQPAIAHLVQTYGDRILFGFDAFPAPGSNCDVDDPILVDIVDDFADNQSVATAMWGTSPDGGSTPLFCGLSILGEPSYAPRLNDQAANKYVVVVSDGADLCGEGCCVPMPQGWPPMPPPECVADETEFATLSTSLRNVGIKSFVIGFDDPSGENVSAEQLDAIAANGGTPFTSFLLASSQSQLEEAFDQIAAQVVSCVFRLEDPGEDVDHDEVNVYFDGVTVGFDEGCANGAGWDWTDASHTAIQFCALACEELQTLTVDSVDVTFGCPTVHVD